MTPSTPPRIGAVLALPVFLLFLYERETGAQGDPTAAPSVVTVEAKQPVGPWSFIFRAGASLTFEFPLGAPFETYFGELPPGAVELMPLRDGVFQSLEEYRRALPSLPVTRWATEVRRRGGIPVISFKDTPLWLQRNPGGVDSHQYPPVDWAGWADYVEATVRFYNGALHLDPEYIVWDEPDLEFFWKGTEDDYLLLYRYSVLGARRADSGARIGGPAVAGWNAKGQGSGSNDPLLYDFIRYAAQTEVPELGLARLPIDFIAWHQFDTDGNGEPLLYDTPAQTVRAWLKQFGYPRDTPLLISAWNTWTDFGKNSAELSRERDTEFAAAYIVHAMSEMDRAGIQQQMFFSLFEGWQWERMDAVRREKDFKDNEFFGGFGLVTRRGIIKPAFNAFKLLARLEGQRIPAATADPYLTVLASRSADRVAVLLANFIWPGENKPALARRRLLEKGYRGPDFTSWGITPEVWSRVQAGEISVESLPFPTDVKRDLALLDDFYRARNGPKTVRVRVASPWPSGQVRLEHYRVDAQHGNSFRAERLLLEEVRRSQGKIEADIAGTLRQWGYLTADFWQADEPERLERLRSVLPRLSPAQRQQVQDAMRAALGGISQRLNRLPQVQIQQMERRTVGAASPDIEITASPYSVHLLVLTAQGNRS